MTRSIRLAAALAVLIALTSCSRDASDPAGAYSSALASVRPDVVGSPAAGPLFLDRSILTLDTIGGQSVALLDSGVARALLAQGLVSPSCTPRAGTGAECVAEPGLYVQFSALERVAGNRVALNVYVLGRSGANDRTLIVGPGYRAHLELARKNGTWTVVAKVRTGPELRAT